MYFHAQLCRGMHHKKACQYISMRKYYINNKSLRAKSTSNRFWEAVIIMRFMNQHLDVTMNEAPTEVALREALATVIFSTFLGYTNSLKILLREKHLGIFRMHHFWGKNLYQNRKMQLQNTITCMIVIHWKNRKRYPRYG